MAKSNKFLKGAFWGGVLGSLGALFLASKYSQGFREDLHAATAELENRALAEAKRLKVSSQEHYGQLVEQVLSQARQQAAEHPELAAALQSGYQEIAAELKSRWEKIKEQLA